ncbi:MAG: hypothetical protein AAGD07_02225 [Planctomycetota bacterium]
MSRKPRLCPVGQVPRVSRCGSIMTELLVAAGLIATMLSTVGSLSHRLSMLNRQSDHYRLAIQEVRNQLQAAVKLPKDELSDFAESIGQHAPANALIPNTTWSASLEDDSMGTRVTVRCQWPSSHGSGVGHQVVLSDWSRTDLPVNSDEAGAQDG